MTMPFRALKMEIAVSPKMFSPLPSDITNIIEFFLKIVPFSLEEQRQVNFRRHFADFFFAFFFFVIVYVFLELPDCNILIKGYVD